MGGGKVARPVKDFYQEASFDVLSLTNIGKAWSQSAKLCVSYGFLSFCGFKESIRLHFFNVHEFKYDGI